MASGRIQSNEKEQSANDEAMISQPSLRNLWLRIHQSNLRRRVLWTSTSDHLLSRWQATISNNSLSPITSELIRQSSLSADTLDYWYDNHSNTWDTDLLRNVNSEFTRMPPSEVRTFQSVSDSKPSSEFDLERFSDLETDGHQATPPSPRKSEAPSAVDDLHERNLVSRLRDETQDKLERRLSDLPKDVGNTYRRMLGRYRRNVRQQRLDYEMYYQTRGRFLPTEDRPDKQAINGATQDSGLNGFGSKRANTHFPQIKNGIDGYHESTRHLADPGSRLFTDMPDNSSLADLMDDDIDTTPQSLWMETQSFAEERENDEMLSTGIALLSALLEHSMAQSSLSSSEVVNDEDGVVVAPATKYEEDQGALDEFVQRLLSDDHEEFIAQLTPSDIQVLMLSLALSMHPDNQNDGLTLSAQAMMRLWQTGRDNDSDLDPTSYCILFSSLQYCHPGLASDLILDILQSDMCESLLDANVADLILDIHPSRNRSGVKVLNSMFDAFRSSSDSVALRIPDRVVVRLLGTHKYPKMQPEDERRRIESDVLQIMDDSVKLMWLAKRQSSINTVLASVLKWGRDGQKESEFFIALFDHFKKWAYKYHEDRSLRPLPYVLWSRIATQLNRLEPTDQVHDTLLALFEVMDETLPSYFPHQQIAMIGLDVAEQKREPELALDLLDRYIQLTRTRQLEQQQNRYSNSSDGVSSLFESLHHDFLSTGEYQISSSISPKVMEKALQVCISAKDVYTMDKLLRQVSHPTLGVPRHVVDRLRMLGLVGASSTEDSDFMLDQLDSISSEALTDESMGAILYAMTMNDRVDAMMELFNNITSDREGKFKPGIACYNAILLSHMKEKRWEEALSVLEDLKEKRLNADATTLDGLLIASMKVGGKEKCIETLQKMHQQGFDCDRASFISSFKYLLRNLVQDCTNIDSIRKELRERYESCSQPEEKQLYLELVSRLRKAERKDDHNELRSPKKRTKRREKRSQNEWRKVQESLVALAVALENQKR